MNVDKYVITCEKIIHPLGFCFHLWQGIPYCWLQKPKRTDFTSSWNDCYSSQWCHKWLNSSTDRSTVLSAVCCIKWIHHKLQINSSLDILITSCEQGPLEKLSQLLIYMPTSEVLQSPTPGILFVLFCFNSYFKNKKKKVGNNVSQLSSTGIAELLLPSNPGSKKQCSWNDSHVPEANQACWRMDPALLYHHFWGNRAKYDICSTRSIRVSTIGPVKKLSLSCLSLSSLSSEERATACLSQWTYMVIFPKWQRFVSEKRSAYKTTVQMNSRRYQRICNLSSSCLSSAYL